MLCLLTISRIILHYWLVLLWLWDCFSPHLGFFIVSGINFMCAFDMFERSLNILNGYSGFRP